MVQIIKSNWWGGGWGGWASYTAWDGIDISAQNEISVEASVISWAEAWATAVQPWDLSWYQTTANMVTSLTLADDDHYPTTLAVANAISSSWGWDVMWPSSSADWDIVLFDWATGKAIKDSSKKLSDYQDKLTTQTAYTSKWTASKVPQITTNTLWQVTWITEVDINYPTQVSNTAYASSWDWVTATAPSKNAVYDKLNSMDTAIGNNTSEISTINWKIPSAATSSNKLADKNYVDDSINSVTAYYITKDAQGNQWATRAELFAATTFYSGWVVRTPTKNDYTIVLADEQHDNATTRYIYNSGWEYQYTVNETALTQAQLDALNSWITSAKVSSYDSAVSTISWYWNIVTHNTSEFATSAQWTKADTALQSGDNVSELVNNAWYITSSYHDSSKQDALTLPATPTQWNLVTWWADNETLVDGWAIPTWVPSGWNNWDVLTNVSWTPTWVAPSSWWITNETTWTTTTVTKIWAWTEAEYALITPNATTIYYVF